MNSVEFIRCKDSCESNFSDGSLGCISEKNIALILWKNSANNRIFILTKEVV